MQSNSPSTSPPKTTLLIDADIYLYKAASAAEEEIDWGDDVWSLFTDLKEAKAIFQKNLDEFTERFETKDYVLCLSDAHNFRKSVDPSYKGHRKKTRKPVGHKALVDWAKETFPTFSKPGLEADDCLGIMSTMPRAGGNAVVISDDKDLMTVPGLLYRPLADERMLITVAAADRFFLTQVLTGDTADGYPGCPTIGPKRAETVLGPRATWANVVKAYQAQGLTEEHALVQARLARILRWEDWDQEKQQPILWSPS